MMLSDMGFENIDDASSLNSALELAETREYDLAICDVNLDSKSSFPVARILQDKGCNLIFATGYSYDEKLFDEFDALLVKKPYTDATLKASIHKALATG